MDRTDHLRRPDTKWLALLGPWPLRPIPVAIIISAFLQFGYTLQLRSEGRGLWFVLIHSAPRSVVVGALAFVTLELVRQLKHRGIFGQVGLGRYSLLLFIGILPISILMSVITELSPQETIYYFARNWTFLVVIQALLGRSEQRLRNEINAKERSLQLLAEQRELIVEADEMARRSVADFLHDRVQASMVVLSMQLNRIANESSGDVGNQLRSITEELERLRKFDLRSASQRLSPDLRIIGLRGALDDLQQFYAAALEIRPIVDDAFAQLAAEHEDRNLGAYRIIEQAVLNAAAHGQATTCIVEVRVATGVGWSISVRNDGNPLAEETEAGAGSAIIDAWVASLGGEWQITNDDGWVHLRATFPE